MRSDFALLPGFKSMEEKKSGRPFEWVISPESALELRDGIAVAGLAHTYSLEEFTDEIKRDEEDKPQTEIHYDDRPIPIPLNSLVEDAEEKGKELTADIKALKDMVNFYRLDVGFNVILPFEGGEQVETLSLRVRLDPQGAIPDTRVAVHQVFPPTEFRDHLSRDKLEAIEALLTGGLALIPKLEKVPLVGQLLKLPGKILAAFPWKVARIIASGSNSGMAHWRLGYQKIAGEVPLTMIMRVPKGTKQMDLLYSGHAKLDTSRWHRGRVYDLNAKTITVVLT